MVNKFFLILFAFLFSINTFAQNVVARASVDKGNYTVGDYINYSIDVNYPKGAIIYPPFIKDSLKSVTLIKKEEPVQKEDKGNFTTSYKYIVAGYDSAGVTIPSIPVFYKTSNDTTMQTVITNPVSFTVSTLKVNQVEGIKDIHAPIKIPLNWKIILLFVLIILIILAVVYYLYRRYMKNKLASGEKKIIIKLPPHAIALSSLNELEAKKLWQQGLIKEYHSEITEIIRKYFEERFKLPALELTTSEATLLLRQRKEAGPILDITYNFLTNADMVKFAKFNPASSINEEMMKQAYEIVNKTVPEESSEVEDVR